MGMQHPADRAIRDMIAERDREIDRLNKEIVRAGKVIAKADELYKASQQIPTSGFQAYKQEKDRAKGEQEAR